MRSRRLQRGMILLVMSLLMAMLTLMAGTSLRLATLQGRSSDGFRNHVQALHAAEIALAHCEEIGDARMRNLLPGSFDRKSERPSDFQNSFAPDLISMDALMASASWQNPRRWERYSAELHEASVSADALPVPPQCVIDELEAPRRFVVTARGFSPNYSRGGSDMAGAEVWVQTVTLPSTTTSATGRSPLHSWRQIVSPPH